MNTLQIAHLLSKILGNKGINYYVCASNELHEIKLKKDIKKTKFVCIVNSDESSSQGTHWLCFLKKSDTVLEFFDSMGLNVDSYGKYFTDFVNRMNCHFQFSRVRIQSLNSSLCGEYCLYYVLRRIEGPNFDEVLSTMTINFHRNDEIVTEYIFRLVKRERCLKKKFRIIVVFKLVKI